MSTKLMESVSKHSHNKLDFVAYFILLVFSITIYGKWVGFWTLDPLHIDWLYAGDYRQNIAAINLFRASDWNFPIGNIFNSDFPVGTNIAFMDGNLLLALIAKVFSPLYPDVFQPYGAWILFCVVLQFWSIYWSLKQLDFPVAPSLLGAVLIGLMPTFFYRVGHLNLLPHFLIIIGWGAVFSKYLTANSKLYIFLGLIVFSILTHFYFTPPLLIMAIIAQWECLKFKRDKSAICFVACRSAVLILVALFTMFVVGYFQKFKTGSFGFGFYSMNLNSLINPMNTSAYVTSLPIGTPGQGEGYQYLGAGLILVFLSALVVFGRNLFSGISKPILIFWLVLVLYSLSNNIYLGSNLVFGVQLPEWLVRITSSFRASGRYMWFVIYPATFIAFYRLYKKFEHGVSGMDNVVRKTTCISVVVLLAVLQCKDISPLLNSRHFGPNPPDLLGEVDVAKKVKEFILSVHFVGPIFIDEENGDTRKTLFTALSYELIKLKGVGISPAPDVRENEKYENRDHVLDTLKAGGLVLTRSCDKLSGYNRINYSKGWCGYISALND